jgi:hypothetical protein
VGAVKGRLRAAVSDAPNRKLARIEASGFHVEELERAEIPGIPPIVRPCVAGRASPALVQ